MKLTVLRSLVTGKRVGVIDDSIGSRKYFQRYSENVFDSGAKEVHFLVASAPVKFPDFYGIDTPKQEKLISSQRQ